MNNPKTVRKSAAPTPASTESKVTPAPDVAPPAPEVVGSPADVERHRRAADALPLARVRKCRADLRLAYHNGTIGRDALLIARPELDATGFHFDWTVPAELESLALATLFAAGRVVADPRTSSEVLTMLREARPLKKRLLSNARTLALHDRCSLTEVERITRGRGAVDTAQDLVDLETLYDQARLVDEHSLVTADDVKRARVLGQTLLLKIRPTGAGPRPKRTSEQLFAIALRDRLWTLWVECYAQIQRAGGALWGAQLSHHVPALQARYVPRERAKPAAAPAVEAPTK